MRGPVLLLTVLACAQRVNPTPGASDAKDYPSLLAEAVQADGTVDYGVLRPNKQVLAAYVASVAPGPAPLGDAGLAESINAYNAFVLLGVLDQEISGSVQELRVGPYPKGGAGFFVGLRFQYRGQWQSLRAFEDKHIREGFKDPRIHAAINCASAGCPPLSPSLFTEAALDAQLEHAMGRFVAERTRIEDGEAVFSQIFEWFESDFLDWGQAENLCAYAGRYEPSYQALSQAGCPHRFEPYDWSLNQSE